MTCGFTLGHYRDILRGWLADGVAFDDFFSRSDGPSVMLRHDVDVDPTRVPMLASIEADLGVRATYFFRVAAEQYNAFAPSSAAAIRGLVALGHEVGLHFDPLLAGEAGWEERLGLEADILGRVAGAPVRVFSVHRPPPDALGWAPASLLNTYAPDLMMPRTRYISDSNMRWREGCACQHRDPDAWGETRTLQVLVHPLWWGEEAIEQAPRILDLVQRRTAALDAELAREITGYGEYRAVHPL